MNPFSWLRAMARQAVVNGVNDGLAAVAGDQEPPADLTALQQKLASVQPAAIEADEPETPKRGRK